MFGKQAYLIRVLRQMGDQLVSEGRHEEGVVVGKIVHYLSDTRNLEETLEQLYQVEGMEQLALRLMWLAGKDPQTLNGLREEVMEYESRTLHSILSDEVDHRNQDRHEPVPESLETALARFSRFIADIRRRLTGAEHFEGFNDDILGRLLDETDVLKKSAEGVGSHEVVLFCGAFSEFIRYVSKRQIVSDVRVLNLIDHANLTLQTVTGSGIAADRQALDQTIHLLNHPADLFESEQHH